VDIENNKKLQLLKELYSKKELSDCCSFETDKVKTGLMIYIRCKQCNRPCETKK
jgi:hypothetical protein